MSNDKINAGPNSASPSGPVPSYSGKETPQGPGASQGSGQAQGPGASQGGGQSTFGPFPMAGAAMIGALIEMLEHLAQVEGEMSTLAGDDIKAGSLAASGSATATIQSGKDQAKATRQEAYAAAGSAFGNVLGLGSMAIAPAFSGTTTSIDKKMAANDDIVDQIDNPQKQKLKPNREFETISVGAGAHGGSTTLEGLNTQYEGKPGGPNIIKNAQRLQSTSYGTREDTNEPLTPQETTDALAYIKKAQTILPEEGGISPNTIADIKERALSHNENLGDAKESILRSRGRVDSVGQLVSQMVGSVSSSAFTYFKSEAQTAQSQEEAQKLLMQFVSQISGTTQQQSIGSRDSKQQQIDQIQQTVNAVDTSNRVN